MRVLVQCGHYPNGGGAPGEAAWTHDLGQRLATRIRAEGIEVALIGDFLKAPPPRECGEDWDLFVALHYDADIYPNRTGCFADRAQFDPAAAASDLAIKAWELIYPEQTGIPLHNERRNPNTWNYYAFRATTARTPGILLEHGVGQGLDKPILFGRIDVVADADAAAILAFLGINGEDDEMAKLTDQQRDMLSLMEAPLHLNADSVRQLVSDKGALEEANALLVAEVTALRQQTPAGISSVAVTFTDNRTEVVSK